MPRSAQRTSLLFLCVFAASFAASGVRPVLADIIHFKDGMRTVCDGMAWEEKDEVRCEHDGGVLIYPRADLKSIEKTLPLETPSEAPPDAPPAAPSSAPPAASAAEMQPAPAAPRAAPAQPSMPRSESGLLFYDPRRPKKYWSSQTRHHDTYPEAIAALAAEYDRPAAWVEQHMADSNDLVEIRRLLEAKLSAGDGPGRPAESAAQTSEPFYKPRRSQPYWTSDTARHSTYADALQALAREFSETPEWVEAHMGESNDINEIRRNLDRAKAGN